MSTATPTSTAYDESRASVAMIESTAEILRVLNEARRRSLPLVGALNRRADREVARVVSVEAQRVILHVTNFEPRMAGRHRLSVEIEGKILSFEMIVLNDRGDQTIECALPHVIYVAERREAERVAPMSLGDSGPRVALRWADGYVVEGEVIDEATSGLGVRARQRPRSAQEGWVRICFLDGEGAGREMFGEVRHSAPDARPEGWVRIGLRVSEVAGTMPVAIERRSQRRAGEVASEIKDRLRLAAAVARQSARSIAAGVTGRSLAPPAIPIVDFRNERGERIRAILDHVGDPAGAPAVIIPPAWGKTKETLSPLAETILETFRRAGESVVVARYDGIRRKGESFNEPDCLVSGREFTKFTVSQALRDIRSMLDFLHRSPEYSCRTAILVTFSASAIEGRRAVALEREARIGGWISVVGAPDLQYAMKVLSGGVDYYGGLRKGFRFGEQEILGTLMDIDMAGLDALDNCLATLEDARRDMAQIRVPVTWIHGRYDGWMSLERVCDVMACGETRNRRLLEIPTGHQLKSSREALETFRLIAAEVGRMALQRSIRGVGPDLGRLERRRAAERARLPRAAVNLRSMWRDYLVGRDGRLGIELMTASNLYDELMTKQVDALALSEGATVADLGSGTGALARCVATRKAIGGSISIHQIDLVREGLVRSRERLAASDDIVTPLRTRAVVADLNVADKRLHIPLASGQYDGVLASLLVSYVERPDQFLQEAKRLLKPGGRLVVSSLCRDADISKIYRDGIAEMSPERVAKLFGATSAEGLEERFRRFLNDGARILDLEDRGYFRFWDEDELAAFVRAAGFSRIESSRAFGNPPQAVVVSGVNR